MGVPRPVKLADGRVHFAKIAYYRFLKVSSHPVTKRARCLIVRYCLQFDLLPFFTGSSSLLQFLKDNGEVCAGRVPLGGAAVRVPMCLSPDGWHTLQARRVGTLVVWVDDMSQPLMAIPINLSIVLDNFPQGQSIIVRVVNAAVRGCNS